MLPKNRKARCNIYIYIFEDGRIGKSASGPREQDLGAIADGTLTVLKCNGVCVITVGEVMEDGSLGQLPVAKLEQCETGEYHYLEGHE